MSRDRFPAGANGKTREAWARRQIALAFGMRPHEAMLYLQGVVREAFGQGKRAGVALASRPGTGEPEVRKCEEPGCETRGMTEAPEWRCAIHHPEHPANTPPPATKAVRLIRWRSAGLLGGYEYRDKSCEPTPEQKRLWGCEEFDAVPAPTPPRATGEECRWYTGNGEEYEILPPEEVRRRRIEAARRLRDVGPATGEAGTRGEVEKARAAFYEAARKVRLAQLRWGEHLEQHGEPGEDSACTCHANLRGSELAFDESYDALLAAEARALPEAREGGGK